VKEKLAKLKISYQELYSMFIDGLTTAEMARRLFVSEATISRRLQEFNLHRDLSRYDKVMYLRMKEVGLSEEQIAYVFCSTKRSLTRWKSRVGLSRKYKTRRSGYGDSEGKEISGGKGLLEKEV
jgi:hypothetical protein